MLMVNFISWAPSAAAIAVNPSIKPILNKGFVHIAAHRLRMMWKMKNDKAMPSGRSSTRTAIGVVFKNCLSLKIASA